MPIFCEIVLEFGRPWVTRKEDVKLAMGPYCRQHKSTAFLFKNCLPLAWSIFLRNRWMMPSHEFWVLLCTLGVFYRHYYMPQSVYNKTQNLCMGSTKMCLLITRHILVLQLGRRRSREYKMRTHCWFNPDLVSFKHYKFKGSCPCKEYIWVSQFKLTNSWVEYKVNQLVSKHLSA